MDIRKNSIGKHRGKEIFQYTINNNLGLELKILNLGCIIRELNFHGKNMVLGYARPEEYLTCGGNFGSVVGRVAGRISKGQVTIDGKTYDLDKNEGDTCLHGGHEGFGSQVWDLVEEEIAKDFISLKFKYISKDMESGFPGQLSLYTKYTINRDNEIIIEYFGQTDKATILNLTNHSYFNLNTGLDETILDHKLFVRADQYISLDSKSIPKEIKNVGDSPFDFRQDRTIGEYMDLSHKDLKETRGYDHPLILSKDGKDEIILSSRESGISLRVNTTEPTVVVYTSNKLEEGMKLSGGENTFLYQGICLETQWYPDAVNQEFLPKKILRPGDKYYSRSSYGFSIEK